MKVLLLFFLKFLRLKFRSVAKKITSIPKEINFIEVTSNIISNNIGSTALESIEKHQSSFSWLIIKK